MYPIESRHVIHPKSNHTANAQENGANGTGKVSSSGLPSNRACALLTPCGRWHSVVRSIRSIGVDRAPKSKSQWVGKEAHLGRSCPVLVAMDDEGGTRGEGGHNEHGPVI